MILSISCKDDSNIDYHSEVTIFNNSTKTIYFGGMTGEPVISYNPLLSGNYFRIPPGGIYSDKYGRERGHGYIEYFWENNNQLYYTFYEEEVLLNNSWNHIRENNLFSKRYSFTLEEMYAANWVIIYDEN